MSEYYRCGVCGKDIGGKKEYNNLTVSIGVTECGRYERQTCVYEECHVTLVTHETMSYRRRDE